MAKLEYAPGLNPGWRNLQLWVRVPPRASVLQALARYRQGLPFQVSPPVRERARNKHVAHELFSRAGLRQPGRAIVEVPPLIPDLPWSGKTV